MNEVVQVAIVTLAALVAAAVIARPYFAKRRSGGPACSNCAASARPAPATKPAGTRAS